MMEKSWLEKLIQDDAKNRRVVKCLEMTEEPLSQKNNNYTSDISRVKMSVELGSGATTVLSFIAKRIPDSEGMREFYKEFDMSVYEALVYENLKVMDQLMEDREDHRDNLWPQLKGHTVGVLVFEDLTAKGYKPFPQEKMLDMDHGEFVLRELARYHAMGIAAVENGLINTTRFKPMYLFDKTAQDKFYIEGVACFRDGVSTWGPEWSESVKQLSQIVENFNHVVQRMDRLNKTTLNLMSHGDCWKGNMLFKYDALGQILSMKFVDFQAVTHCSYVYDLVIFLYSSIEPEVRLNKSDELLERYRESLQANLEFYNVSKKSAPLLKEIKDALKYFLPVTIILMALYWIPTSNECEFKVSNAYEKDKKVVKPEMYTSEKCKRVLGRMLRQMIGMDVLGG